MCLFNVDERIIIGNCSTRLQKLGMTNLVWCGFVMDHGLWKENKSYMAVKLFNEMGSLKCKLNICTYTAHVNAFAREGSCEKDEEIFELMQEHGLEHDVYAYNALIEAYRFMTKKVVMRLV